MTASDPLPRDRYEDEMRKFRDLVCELSDSDDPQAAELAQRAFWLRRMEPAPRKVINRRNARGGSR